MTEWKPNVTVAALVEREGRLLVIRERTRQGVRLNLPSGHLDPGESLAQAVEREALEETGWQVQVKALVGVYLSRYQYPPTGTDRTYLRFAFACEPLSHDATRTLDHGIVETGWLTPVQIHGRADEHRGTDLQAMVDDYLAGRRFPLEMLHTSPHCLHSGALI